MLKDATYQEKFATLKKNQWLTLLIDSVKKDLKSEHLKQDPIFFKKYFTGKNYNKLTVEDLVQGYSQAIEDGMEQAGEFISNRWVVKHSEIYHFFEEELKKISPDFNEIKELDKQKSTEIMDASIRQFGAPNTYLFSVLNSVVFPQDVYHQLSEKAHQKRTQETHEEKVHHEKQSLESMKQEQEREIARLTDKYEKKLSGMQKKYNNDVDALKRQLATLQRKLSGSPAA